MSDTPKIEAGERAGRREAIDRMQRQLVEHGRMPAEQAKEKAREAAIRADQGRGVREKK